MAAIIFKAYIDSAAMTIFKTVSPRSIEAQSRAFTFHQPTRLIQTTISSWIKSSVWVFRSLLRRWICIMAICQHRSIRRRQFLVILSSFRLNLNITQEWVTTRVRCHAIHITKTARCIVTNIKVSAWSIINITKFVIPLPPLLPLPSTTEIQTSKLSCRHLRHRHHLVTHAATANGIRW